MNSLRVIVTGFVFAFAAIASAQISVSSPAFPAGGMIPARFTCKGTNVNPPLQFSGVPQGTKSLALIVDDPDAPGGLFTHWLIWNIDSGTTQLREKSGPAGAVEGTNDFGARGYCGPCPPSGTHRYYFRLFALDQKLDLKSGAKRAALERACKSHILAQAELMARSSH